MGAISSEETEVEVFRDFEKECGNVSNRRCTHYQQVSNLTHPCTGTAW